MLPSVFVSHGAPTLAIAQDATTKFLNALGNRFKDVAGVVVVSAHWESAVIKVTSADSLDLIYDFYGFPAPLYEIKFPVKGSPSLAKQVRETLLKADIKCEFDEKRGLDHGAWVPIKHMYQPPGTIPIVQLSLGSNLDPEFHIELGKALRPLRDSNVLILGSGGATHNLRAINDFTSKWPREFLKKLESALKLPEQERLAKLGDLIRSGIFDEAHPRNEHFLPLLVALGAAVDGKATKVHDSMEFGTLSLASFEFSN